MRRENHDNLFQDVKFNLSTHQNQTKSLNFKLPATYQIFYSVGFQNFEKPGISDGSLRKAYEALYGEMLKFGQRFQFMKDFKRPKVETESVFEILLKDKYIKKSIPVPFIRGWNIWRMTPLAHLQDSDEKQWMDSKNARRNCDTHDSRSPLSSIAEVECIREGI